MLTIHNSNNYTNFCAMKKSQFNGVDFAVVEKYKAPIEKFNYNTDLQGWAFNNSMNVIRADYSGRKATTETERQKVMDNWVNYLYKEDSRKFSDTEKFLILKGITQNLKTNNDTLPPVFNKQVLSYTMYGLKQDLKANKQLQFTFNDRYKTNLKDYYADMNDSEQKGKWIVIPSIINDPEHYEENVDKLRTFSPDGWCTKTDYADIYLKTGDFHVFVVNGEAKLGLRFDGDEIHAIEGQKNDYKIPIDYLDVCKSYINEHKYKMNDKSIAELEKANEKKIYVDRIKKDIAEPIKNGNTEKILNYFGMYTKKDEDGKLILSEYKKPKNIDYAELGISENRMFKDIVKIEGDAELDGGVTNLGALKEINGNAEIGLRVRNLGNLEKVGGVMNVYSYDIENADNLRDVKGGIQFFNGVKWHIYTQLIGRGVPAYIY